MLSKKFKLRKIDNVASGFGTLCILFAVSMMVIFGILDYYINDVDINTSTGMDIVQDDWGDKDLDDFDDTNESVPWWWWINPLVWPELFSGYAKFSAHWFLGLAQDVVNLMTLNIPLINDAGIVGNGVRYITWAALMVGIVEIVWIG